jgi:YesN/AraC family two-component response regulator
MDSGQREEHMMDVLLIERYPTAGGFLKQLLGQERPQLRYLGQVFTAEEGIRQVRELQPDLVILEPMLFGHGAETMRLKLVALREACPKAKLIGISSSDRAEHIRAALRAGLSDYLYKPLQRREMLAAIDRCCGALEPEVELPPPTESHETLIRELVQQVQAGNREGCIPLLHHTCQKLGDSYSERCILYLEIATAVIHIPDNMDSVPDELVVLYQEFIKNASRHSNLDELNAAMDSFLEQSTGLFNRYIIDQGYHQIQAALHFVDEHLGEDLSLKRLSKEFYISTTYFSRLFRAKTGLKFSEYLAERRIERAKLLLTTTNAPVTEIAKQVGYHEPNSFTRLFKARTGMTPVQYRNQKKVL